MPRSIAFRTALARLALITAAGALAAGCVGVGATTTSSEPADSSATPGLELPTDGDTLLVQVRTEGGFVAPSLRFQALPQVSVYADGRVIEQGATVEIYPGPLLPSLPVRRLSSGQLGDLLKAADAAGLRPVSATSYPPHGIADAGETVIEVWSAAGPRTTSFGAFGMEQTGMDATETAARAAAAAFLERLQETAGTSEGAYMPTAARLIVRPYQAPDPAVVQPSIAWPLATPLASASPLIEGSPAEGGCLVVAGSDLTTLWPLLEKANALTPWVSAGDRYALTVRPLLPNEAPACE